MTNINLIDKIQKGDREAFNKLVLEYQQMVFNTCMGFVHSKADADDLSQEVFIEVYQSIAKFRKDSKISTWIYRIAVNKSLNFIRSQKKHSVLRSIESFFSTSENSQLEIPENTNHQADAGVETEEQKEVLSKALNALAENQRIAFVLNKYEDLPYKEIAEIMDISLSSVESLIFRAKKNLQKKLLNFYKNERKF